MKFLDKSKTVLLLSSLLIPNFSFSREVEESLISTSEKLQEFERSLKEVRSLKMGDIPGFLESLKLPDGTIQLFKGVVIESPKAEKGPKGPRIEDGLTISGRGKIKDKFPIEVKLNVVIKDGVKRFSVGFGLPEEMKISDIVPDFKTLDKLSIPSVAVEISEFDYETEAEGGIERGLNVSGEWELTGPLQLVQKFLDKMRERLEKVKAAGKLSDAFIFEGDSLNFTGVIREDIAKSRFQATIPLRIGIDFTKFGKAKVFTFIKTADWRIEMEPLPDLEFEISGGIILGLASQEEPIELRGGVELSATKAGIDASMQGMLELAFDKLKFAIGDFGFEIIVDYEVEAIAALAGIPFTGLGGRGELQLGKRKDTGERAKIDVEILFSVETADQLEVVIKGGAENLRFSDFIMFVLNLAKKDVSFDLPLINLKKLTAYAVPRAVEFAGKEYDAGFSVDAEVEIGKLTGGLNFRVMPENLQISGSGRLSKIDTKFFKLTGAGPDGKEGTADDGPSMQLGIFIDRPAQSFLTLDGQVEIPPLDLKVGMKNASIKKSGIEGSFEAEIVKVFSVTMDLNLPFDKPEEFVASIDFQQDFVNFMENGARESMVGFFSKLKQKAQDALKKLDEKIEKKQSEYRNLVEEEIKRVTQKIDELKKEIDDLTRQIKSARGVCLKIGKKEECEALNKNRRDRALKRVARASLITYKGAILKVGAKIPDIVLTVADEIVELGRRQKLQEKSVNILNVFFDVFVKLIKVVDVKKVSGEVSGKDLSEGKLPKLKELLIEFNLDATILKKEISIKKTLELKDIQFDFKEPGKYIKPIAEELFDRAQKFLAEQFKVDWIVEKFSERLQAAG